MINAVVMLKERERAREREVVGWVVGGGGGGGDGVWRKKLIMHRY